MSEPPLQGSLRCTEPTKPLLGSSASRMTNPRFRKAAILAGGSLMLAFLLTQLRASGKSQLVQRWIVPASAKLVKPNPKMTYMYVKSSALHYDKTKKRQVLDLNDAKIQARVAKQVQHRIQGLGFTFKKYRSRRTFKQGRYTGQEMRTCALYNLVTQANLVFDGWKECGYILQSGSEGEPQHGNLDETSGHAVISAPPNITDCTPDKMNTEPCKTMWTRTLARNHESLLEDCLKRIRGVSQTCRSFDRCGPHFRIPKGQDAEDKKLKYRSICHTKRVGYFKEPAIQRMCGICDMYRATVSLSFKSPKAGFKLDPLQAQEDSATRGAPGVAHAVLALACAAAGILAVRPAA